MTARACINRIVWRVAGLGALGIACLSSLAHRHFMQTAASEPASVWEFLFGLLSFCFGSLGILLLLRGKRLFDSNTVEAVKDDPSGTEPSSR